MVWFGELMFRWDKETASRYNTPLKAETLPTRFCHAETLVELGIDEDVFETLQAVTSRADSTIAPSRKGAYGNRHFN
ncbi:hypothetical protein F2Q68_00043063 [Brassica cretica]|uniref:Uncharacterized protein n=1 Tax=Brassica cretica TaxID=69181 RepID=A0A8S9LLJ8_BRACR|nr:hypothetical protein F2Q68_00043063 [Brassica cretica]